MISPDSVQYIQLTKSSVDSFQLNASHCAFQYGKEMQLSVYNVCLKGITKQNISSD